MPSEKREEKKKSHRKRRKKYSRSTEGKNKRKKSRDDNEHTKDQVLETDISNYVDDPAELLSRVYTNLGESYIAEATPPIFKSLRQLELKKLCLRELAMLPKEAVIRIMHGLSPEDVVNTAQCSSVLNPDRKLRVPADTKRQKKKRRYVSRRKHSSPDSSSDLSLESSSEVKSSVSEDTSISKLRRGEEGIRNCGEGTSSQSALPVSHSPSVDDSAHISSTTDPEERESEDVNTFEGNESPNETLQFVQSPSELEENENGNEELTPKISVAFLQPVPEVTELEYRARAIRSMIANIDKINEKSFEGSSIQ